MSPEDIWLAYFSLGGRRSSEEISRYLLGDLDLPGDQCDVLAATLFEQTGIFEPDDQDFRQVPEKQEPWLEAVNPWRSGAGTRAIQSAIWIEKSGHAAPSPQSESNFLARSLEDGNLVRLDRSPVNCWEVHPAGDEVIHLLSGAMRVSIDVEGSERGMDLAAGQSLVIPQNTWHRHVTTDAGSVLFVTPLRGTQQRKHSGTEGSPESTGLTSPT